MAQVGRRWEHARRLHSPALRQCRSQKAECGMGGRVEEGGWRVEDGGSRTKAAPSTIVYHPNHLRRQLGRRRRVAKPAAVLKISADAGSGTAATEKISTRR